MRKPTEKEKKNHLAWRRVRTHTLSTHTVSHHIKESATNHAHGQSAALREGRKLEVYQSDKF